MLPPEEMAVMVALRTPITFWICRTRFFVGPTQRVFGLARVVDTPPRDTVGGGELHIIGTPDRRARIAATMKELLPLPHHAEVAVVEDRELYLEPFLHHGGDLGHVHLKSTVAGKGPDRLVRTSEGDHHPGRDPQAH